jgi:hypothetical protein
MAVENKKLLPDYSFKSWRWLQFTAKLLSIIKTHHNGIIPILSAF